MVCLRAVLFLLIAGCALAAEPSLPRCTAENRGDFWPDSANSDRHARKHWTQCGELRICQASAWKFEWKLVSVHVSQLGGKSHARTPGCDLDGALSPAPESSGQDLLFDEESMAVQTTGGQSPIPSERKRKSES